MCANRTKVLACCIVLVFFVGLCKLWWVNRSVRKHELLDEEKKARITEIKKTGLPFGKRPDIPFGVRAIQSGVEVDGIWISKPGTPNSESPTGASSLTLGVSDSDLKGKAKVTAESARTSPRQSPTSSTFGPERKPTPPPKPPGFMPKSTYRPRSTQRKHSVLINESYNADAARQHEESSERPALQTYVPTTSFSSVRAPAQVQRILHGDRNSSSSEEGSHPSSMRTTSRREAALSKLNGSGPSDGDYYLGTREGSLTSENPFTTPEPSIREVTRVTTEPQIPPSHPTRAYSGESYMNRSSRRVNAGFEVLPAGTFDASNGSTVNGSQVDLERGEGTRSSSRYSRPVVNKLQRNDRSYSRG